MRPASERKIVLRTVADWREKRGRELVLDRQNAGRGERRARLDRGRGVRLRRENAAEVVADLVSQSSQSFALDRGQGRTGLDRESEGRVRDRLLLERGESESREDVARIFRDFAEPLALRQGHQRAQRGSGGRCSRENFAVESEGLAPSIGGVQQEPTERASRDGQARDEGEGPLIGADRVLEGFERAREKTAALEMDVGQARARRIGMGVEESCEDAVGLEPISSHACETGFAERCFTAAWVPAPGFPVAGGGLSSVARDLGESCQPKGDAGRVGAWSDRGERTLTQAALCGFIVGLFSREIA